MEDVQYYLILNILFLGVLMGVIVKICLAIGRLDAIVIYFCIVCFLIITGYVVGKAGGGKK